MARSILIVGIGAALALGGVAVWMNQQPYPKPVRICQMSSPRSDAVDANCNYFTVAQPKYAATTPVVEYAAFATAIFAVITAVALHPWWRTRVEAGH